MSIYRLGDEGTFTDKMKRWFYSKKNIAGCGVAAVAAPALVITGVAAPPLALALIPIFYTIGALVGPSERKEQHMLEYNLDRADSADINESLSAIQESVNGKVSRTVQQEIDAIVDTIRNILPRAGELGLGSDEMHILRRTATDYLPSTISPYLAMPRMYAEHATAHNGMTPEQILLSQLDLIGEKLQHIEHAIMQNDMSKILSNGQFLKERFGTEKLALPSKEN